MPREQADVQVVVPDRVIRDELLTVEVEATASADLLANALTRDIGDRLHVSDVTLALDEAVRDGRIQRGQHLLLEAFGGGFPWGSALVRY